MRVTIFVPLVFAVVGCSSGVRMDDTMNRTPTTGALNYPAGPYGYAQGSVIANLLFTGKKDPDGAGGMANYANLPMTQLQVGDYFSDPNVKYLYMSGNAGWCKPCNDEQPYVKAAQAKYEPKGIRFLEALNQGFDRASGAPATEADVNKWAARHQLHLAIGSDPTDQIHQYADVSAFPLNMVIRTSDMQIVFMQVGEQDIDSILAQYAQ